MSQPTAVVLGVGPGLGLSIAQRFGREGYAVALVSRTDKRHADYISSLADKGITAEGFAADVTDPAQLTGALDRIKARFGQIDFLYYGPGAVDPEHKPTTILETTPEAAAKAMVWTYPAIQAANHVLPGMVERGTGGVLFAGGLSAVVPMPPLGPFAVSSAALHNYAVTLNAGLAGTGVFAGTLTIGGLIERGDIHEYVLAHMDDFPVGMRTLNPDEIADAAWDLFTEQDSPQATFNAFA